MLAGPWRLQASKGLTELKWAGGFRPGPSTDGPSPLCGSFPLLQSVTCRVAQMLWSVVLCGRRAGSNPKPRLVQLLPPLPREPETLPWRVLPARIWELFVQMPASPHPGWTMCFSQGVFHRVFTARAARWENDSAEFTDKPDFNGYVFLFIIVVSSTYSAYHYHPHAVWSWLSICGTEDSGLDKNK